MQNVAWAVQIAAYKIAMHMYVNVVKIGCNKNNAYFSKQRGYFLYFFKVRVITIYAYAQPLTNMVYFNHLGRLLMVMDGYWLAVLANLWKYRHNWAWMSLILVR